MSNVFISYSQKDLERAEVVVRRLRDRGVSIWWDRKIFVGDDYRELIGRKLHEADCVIVLWSQHSVGSSFVIDEAAVGQQRRVLVPVLIDDVPIPLGFGAIHTESLVGRLDDETVLDNVAAAVHRLVGHSEAGPAARAAATPAARGKARAATPSSGGAGRRPLLLAAGAVVLAALVGLVLWWPGADEGDQVGPDPEPVVTDPDVEEDGSDGQGDEPPPGPPADPRLVAAHARLDQLGGAASTDLDGLLATCRTVLDTIDAGDERTLALLADLERRWSGDPDARQRVADVQRWIGKPVGAGLRYDQALATFEQELAAFALDAAGEALENGRQILPRGRELSDAQQRLATTIERRQEVLDTLAALQAEPVHLPSLGAARTRGQELADQHPALAQHLELPSALERSRHAYELRVMQLEGDLDGAVRGLRRADAPRDAADALLAVDESLAELPADRVAERQDALEQGFASAAERILGGAGAYRPGLELLTELAPRSRELIAPATTSLADDLVRTTLEHLVVATDSLTAIPARCQAVADLAGCEATIADDLVTAAGRLDQLAGALLGDLYSVPGEAEAARQERARVDGHFPEVLPGRIGERVVGLRSALQEIIDGEQDQLRAAFAEAQRLLDQGQPADADDRYKELLKQVERGTGPFAAARLGRAEVERAGLPERPELNQVNDVDDVIDAYLAVRRLAEPRRGEPLRDLEGRSIPAFCSYRVVELKRRIKATYKALAERYGRDEFVKQNNKLLGELQDEKERFLELYEGERDHDGQLLSARLYPDG